MRQAWVVRKVPHKANLTVPTEDHQQKMRRSCFKSGKSLVADAPGGIPGASGARERASALAWTARGHEKKNIRMLY